jgi:opacity protein-like surface antigen
LIAGYDFQIGRLVIGVQGDVAYQGNKRNRFSQQPGTPIRDEVQIPLVAHALARVGLDIKGWLLFVSAGAVGATVKASHTGFITPTNTFTWRQKDFRIAKSYGAGIEKQFAGGWSLRGEYLYDYWGPKRYNWVPGQRYSDIGLTIHNVRFVLAKRFGTAPPPPPPLPPLPPPPSPSPQPAPAMEAPPPLAPPPPPAAERG